MVPLLLWGPIYSLESTDELFSGHPTIVGDLLRWWEGSSGYTFMRDKSIKEGFLLSIKTKLE